MSARQLRRPRFLVPPFIHWWRIMHAAISIRSNSILVRGRRARRVEFPYRPPADGMEMRGWKTTRLELYLDASFSVSCRASRETQTQILRTTALFDGALAQNSRDIIWTPLWRRDFPLGNSEIMIVKLITRRCRSFKLFLPIFNSNFNQFQIFYCIITLLGVVVRLYYFCRILLNVCFILKL